MAQEQLIAIALIVIVLVAVLVFVATVSATGFVWETVCSQPGIENLAACQE